jgi:hypothetical protein
MIPNALDWTADYLEAAAEFKKNNPQTKLFSM